MGCRGRIPAGLSLEVVVFFWIKKGGEIKVSFVLAILGRVKNAVAHGWPTVVRVVCAMVIFSYPLLILPVISVPLLVVSLHY